MVRRGFCDRVEETQVFARVGIIGSGPVGRAIATRALAARIPSVLSNSRGPDTLTELVDELGEGASAGTVALAADANLVAVAIPFVKVPQLSAEVPDWSGRVVDDATNQFAQYEPAYAGVVDLGDETGSEWMARHLVGATVIKAFNVMYAEFAAFGEALGRLMQLGGRLSALHVVKQD
jgi:8-hydroxy-5-deazaflavin:NADPH oxidoreductase